MRQTDDLASRLISTENTALPAAVVAGGSGPVDSVAVGLGGRLMATSGRSGTLRLWDVADPGRPRLLSQPVTGRGYYLDSLALSPDGRMLAAGSETTGMLELFNVTDPAHPRALGKLASPGSVGVFSLAFSPVTHLLASGGADGKVRLWNVADPRRPRPAGPPLTGSALGQVSSVAFSPDGKTLADSGWDATVRLWNVADPARPQPLGPPLSGGTAAIDRERPVAAGAVAVDSVSFSQDGRMLASGDWDGTVRLWNVADPAHPEMLGQPHPPDTEAIRAVAFSPNSQVLATRASMTRSGCGTWPTRTTRNLSARR